MNIMVIKTGKLEENCYIITENKDALIIDPGDDYNKINDCIKNNKLNICGILITHYHLDHTKALNELKRDYNVPVISIKNKLLVNNFKYEIIETKGHTDDSVSYFFKKENLLFCGDFIFKESIGRYDFYNSSEYEMFKSINKLKKFNRNLKIYPGHGEMTTLDYELKNNIYLR